MSVKTYSFWKTWVNPFYHFWMPIVAGYGTWIVLHYVSANLYQEFCAARTLQGFLLSPFISTMPQCKALRWLIGQGSVYMDAMWVALGAYLSCKLVGLIAGGQ
jgi:hypothetical protein